jgi:transcriptional regulator with XRE-family HTH domain
VEAAHSFHPTLLDILNGCSKILNVFKATWNSFRTTAVANIKNRVEVPVGRYLAQVRDEAGLTQAQLAGKVTFSAASISRIESGDKTATAEELADMLKAIDTAGAQALGEYLGQSWDKLPQPPFDHPDRDALWEANLTLRKLEKLREKPELKGVFVRQIDLYERELQRLAAFLLSCDHQVAFIGTIGVGKSTGICKLAGLTKPGESKLDREIVLETGAGGITLCEVHIVQGPEYGLRIEPRNEDAIRADVADFAEYLNRVARPDTQQAKGSDEDWNELGISKEVVRAIRNMAGLVSKSKKEDGRRVSTDPAKELAAQHSRDDDLTIQILTRMNLLRRNRREAWYPKDSSQPPMDWLQELFTNVNNGRNSEFTMPSRIEVIVPDPVLASKALALKIIDTKGVDQTAEREDLECHFDDCRTQVVLCTRFNDSPDMTTQTLLQRAKEAGVRDIEAKTLILVLPRPDEAMAVKHDGGAKVEDEQEGYELKKDQIDLRLNGMNLYNLPVVFFNAGEDDTEAAGDQIIEKIVQYRRLHATQITEVSKAVDHLIHNLANEEIRLVFEQVGRHLSTWIDRNRKIELEGTQVQGSLLAAIDNIHAGKVRASVNRWGSSPDLDYYYQLGSGARRIAVRVVGSKIEKFKEIVDNQLHNPELAPAKAFLESVLHSVDTAVGTAYSNVQLAGREAFKDELRGDMPYWQRCQARWGSGEPYKPHIRMLTGDQFDSSYDDARQLVRNRIGEEWDKIVRLLEGLLKEKGVHAAPAAE